MRATEDKSHDLRLSLTMLKIYVTPCPNLNYRWASDFILRLVGLFSEMMGPSISN